MARRTSWVANDADEAGRCQRYAAARCRRLLRSRASPVDLVREQLGEEVGEIIGAPCAHCTVLCSAALPKDALR